MVLPRLQGRGLGSQQGSLPSKMRFPGVLETECDQPLPFGKVSAKGLQFSSGLPAISDFSCFFLVSWRWGSGLSMQPGTALQELVVDRVTELIHSLTPPCVPCHHRACNSSPRNPLEMHVPGWGTSGAHRCSVHTCAGFCCRRSV